MSNYIIDKVTALQRMDADIDKHKSAANITISMKEAQVTSTRNSSFVNDCVGYISNFYNYADHAVKTICDLQNGINIGNEYKLKTYLNVAPLSYKSQDFLNVYEKASKEFSTNIKNIASTKTFQQITASTVPGYLEKIASSYVTLRDINARARKLALDYATPVIGAEVKKLQDEIEKFRLDSNEKTKKLIENLKAAVAELEECVRKEEEKQALSFIATDEEMNTEFAEDYSLCVGRSALKNQTISFNSKNINYNKTFTVSTLSYTKGYEAGKSSNIKLDISSFDEQKAYNFAENIIMKFLLSYPGQFKKVVALHNQAGSGLLSVMSQAYNCGQNSDFALVKGMDTVANNETSIENVLTMLDNRINEVCSKLGVSGHNDVYSYNAVNDDTAEPIVLVVIKDFPSGLVRSRSLDLFKRVYEQGNKAGIITVVLWDKNQIKENYGEEKRALDMIASLPAAYDLVGNKDGSITYSNFVFTPITKKPNFNSQKFFEKIHTELKKQNNAIGLLDIQSKTGFNNDITRRKNFSESLIIPVGKLGGKPMSLELSSSNKAHVVVNGGTGSGKTAFLHTLILSAAYNYSPAELEINLFDFKDGVGFKMYKEEATRLPHVKFIALENKIEDALEVLEFLNSEMTRRNKLISSISGVSSLKGYNDKAPSLGKPVIPRSLVIIDEYQFLLMNEKCVSILENIARQGRSAGISLVLVSQDVPNESGFTKIKQLLDHRFAFRGSPENVDRLITGAGRRSTELELQKGICFYEANDSMIRSMRVAFSGDDEQLAKNIKFITEETKKRGGYDKNREMQIVGAPKPLLISDYTKVPTIDKTKRTSDYLDKGVFNMILGEYGLTGDPVEYVSNEDNTLLTVVGGYIKSKQIITTIICNHLITLADAYKVKKNADGKVILVDLCDQRRLATVGSPLQDLINKKVEMDDEDDPRLNNLLCYDSDGFDDAVDYVYNVYKKRLEDKNASIDPIELILLGTNYCGKTDRDMSMEQLRQLILNGHKCDIYITVQADTLDSAFAKNVLFQRAGANLVKDLIILSDDSGSSLGIRNALTAISGLIGPRTASEYIKSFEKNPLDSSLCLLVDDGSISKYSHFQYEGKDWLNSFINYLN